MEYKQRNNKDAKGALAVLLCTLCLVTSAQEDVSYETVTYAGYTFSVSDSALPWSQATEACEGRGQKLASVENPEKDDVLVQLFSEHKHTSITLKGNTWVSATEVREGVWHRDSLDKPLYYSRWFMDGQPDDKENLNCVYLASEWMLYWRDANCSASMYFICESVLPDVTTTTEGSAISSQSFSPFVLLFSTFLIVILFTQR